MTLSVAEALARLCLGQSDGADRRVGEDHRRDVVVVEVAAGLAAEQPVGAGAGPAAIATGVSCTRPVTSPIA